MKLCQECVETLFEAFNLEYLAHLEYLAQHTLEIFLLIRLHSLLELCGQSIKLYSLLMSEAFDVAHQYLDLHAVLRVKHSQFLLRHSYPQLFIL